MSGNVEHTKTHMDGLEKMLEIGNSSPNPMIREILFWTDLLGSAFAHTPLRGYSPRPPKGVTRLHCLPVFLYQTTLAFLCRGFQPVLMEPAFEPLIDPLHELRCLTIAFHFSSGKAHVELSIFTEMSSTINRRLQSISHKNTSPIFEVCRVSSILFVNLVLLSRTTNFLTICRELKSAITKLLFRNASPQGSKLMLWGLFIGAAATLETELGRWFLEQFTNTLVIYGLRNLNAVKSVLVEFFWINGICDTLLISILEKWMAST